MTEAAVRRSIEEKGLSTVEQVTAATSAAGGCSSCYDDVAAILSALRGQAPVSRAAGDLTDAEKRARVLAAFDAQARRLFAHNALDVEILDVHGDRVFCRYRGALAGTQQPSFLTLKRHLVTIFSAACGRKMQQIEINVLEDQGVGVLP